MWTKHTREDRLLSLEGLSHAGHANAVTQKQICQAWQGSFQDLILPVYTSHLLHLPARYFPSSGAVHDLAQSTKIMGPTLIPIGEMI